MIRLTINDIRHVTMSRTETVYKGDNEFSAFHIYFPEKFNEFPYTECTVEMRCFITEDGYLSYPLDTSKPENTVAIKNDLTIDSDHVDITFIIRHGDDEIGHTNVATLPIHKVPRDESSELTPRKDFDIVIERQRQKIAEQEAQLAEDVNTISGLNSQVIELSGQVSELTAENTELESQHRTDQGTIQYMIDNPPRPNLETPDMLIPEYETRLYTPREGFDGFASVTVKGNRYLNVDLQKFLARAIDFNLEIQADNIGSYLCYNQKGLINCLLTGSPTSIGQYAFCGCSALQSINIPEGVTGIGDCAFEGCGSLALIELPSTLNIIGDSAFRNCSALTSLTIPEGVTSISSRAFYYAGIKKIRIPSSVSSIGYYYTFYGSPLQEMEFELPSSVRVLDGYEMFRFCPLTRINLPASLTSATAIGVYTSSLKYVTLENNFNCSINLSYSTLYSVETIVSWLEALKDLTGETAKTLTMGATNLNKLTAEQKAIATNKNWNLA